MEASGAKFHVDASFQTGKSDSRLAGGAAVSATMTPSHLRHHRNSLWKRKYSPPNFRSCAPSFCSEIIANRLGVLEDVQGAGTDGVAAQLDYHRSAVEDGMIRKVVTLPSDDGLVLPLIVGQNSFELVHRPVAHDLRQSREILC